MRMSPSLTFLAIPGCCPVIRIFWLPSFVLSEKSRRDASAYSRGAESSMWDARNRKQFPLPSPSRRSGRRSSGEWKSVRIWQRLLGNGLSRRNGTTFVLLSAQRKPSPSQANLMDCCCRGARGAYLARSPGSPARPSQKGKPDCGIRRQTLELATRQTTESATPAAHSSLTASIERPSGCSSLATLRRSNRQTSYRRTHRGIATSGLGLPGMSRNCPTLSGGAQNGGAENSAGDIDHARSQWPACRG
jgi:hypothetical protein